MSKLILVIISLFVIRVHTIFNGRITSNKEFPNIVVITFNDTSYCGGSIILPKLVLTSAVCGCEKDHITGVIFNFDDLFDLFSSDNPQIISIIDVIVHPKFKLSNRSATNDIAIVELSRAILFSEKVTAIPIYEKMVRVGEECKVAGWGVVNPEVLTMENVEKAWPDQNRLRTCQQLIVDISICEKQIEDDDIVLDKTTHICTRGLMQEQGPSYGDFGGPLICQNQQAGVATHSLYDMESRYLYTVYTPVIIHEDWIRSVVGLEEGLQPKNTRKVFKKKKSTVSVQYPPLKKDERKFEAKFGLSHVGLSNHGVSNVLHKPLIFITLFNFNLFYK